MNDSKSGTSLVKAGSEWRTPTTTRWASTTSAAPEREQVPDVGPVIEGDSDYRLQNSNEACLATTIASRRRTRQSYSLLADTSSTPQLPTLVVS